MAGRGAGLGKRRERGGRGKRRGGKGRAPKLLLNQGPSEPCYATDSEWNAEFNSVQQYLLPSFTRSFYYSTHNLYIDRTQLIIQLPQQYAVQYSNDANSAKFHYSSAFSKIPQRGTESCTSCKITVLIRINEFPKTQQSCIFGHHRSFTSTD